MSYDIFLEDPVSGETLCSDVKHGLQGGTYVVGGTTELHLNVTYNYGSHYYNVFGKNGIRSLYGKTGAEAIPLLDEAISKLGDDVTERYWDATEGNAKRALCQLKALAQIRPDGVFNGD